MSLDCPTKVPSHNINADKDISIPILRNVKFNIHKETVPQIPEAPTKKFFQIQGQNSYHQFLCLTQLACKKAR